MMRSIAIILLQLRHIASSPSHSQYALQYGKKYSSSSERKARAEIYAVRAGEIVDFNRGTLYVVGEGGGGGGGERSLLDNNDAPTYIQQINQFTDRHALEFPSSHYLDFDYDSFDETDPNSGAVKLEGVTLDNLIDKILDDFRNKFTDVNDPTILPPIHPPTTKTNVNLSESRFCVGKLFLQKSTSYGTSGRSAKWKMLVH